MSAMPIMIGVLCLMAVAYRYYSAFLAAKVAALDDSRETPAVRLNDGQNFHPTNKWVLFGHHFAAISGAGPLIGAVLDFLVLAASIRRNGQSLAQIAFKDIGRVAGTAATVAILFIVVIALAGLGKVVVKALGGETVAYPAGSALQMPTAWVNGNPNPAMTYQSPWPSDEKDVFFVPPGTVIEWP